MTKADLIERVAKDMGPGVSKKAAQKMVDIQKNLIMLKKEDVFLLDIEELYIK